MGINFANLTKIPFKPNNMVNIKNRFKITVCNIKSVKPKEDDLLTYLNTSHTNAFILTETWLRSTDSDKALPTCISLNTNNYRMIASNRKNRCGGELALVHKVTLPEKTLTAGETRSFKYAKWSTRVPGLNMVIIAIYHSPYSIKYPVTNAMFIDDITEWLLDQLVQSNNIVVAGDFNIHINKQVENDEVGIFVSTLESMGLVIHELEETHKSGYILDLLDLILTELGSTVKVLDYKCGPCLSDHSTVECTTSIIHDNITRKQISY